MLKNVNSCASRGRSDGDWYQSEHRQKLEVRYDGISNAVTSLQKDFMVIGYDEV